MATNSSNEFVLLAKAQISQLVLLRVISDRRQIAKIGNTRIGTLSGNYLFTTDTK